MFCKDFLWGAATAAHQVEGNNKNADLWVEENVEGSPYIHKSGIAIDHYRLYREDIKLLANLGLNSYRFSIEWARIEPEKGVYSKDEIEHYKDVLKTCYENNMIPIVTLFHFTSPKWLMEDGGWSNPKTVEYFSDYCEFVIKELGEYIPYVITINEVNLPVMLKEIFLNYDFIPPVGIDIKSWNAPKWREKAALECNSTIEKYFTFHMASDENSIFILKEAHEKARNKIKKIRKETKVGISFALPDIQCNKEGEKNAENVKYLYFKQYIDILKEDDFIGVQNYTREVYGKNGIETPGSDKELTEMGYEFYPEGLEGVIKMVSNEVDLPILITENGIATQDDERRTVYIEKALKGVKNCIDDGIRIDGYFYWSAFDNFEWQSGYNIHFGIIGVNRENQERKVKNSGYFLGDIAKNNGI
jgi:beta-glucosidase